VGSDDGGNDRLIMPAIHFSDYFWPSVKEYNGDKIRLTARITEFITWKETGVQPYLPFEKDKSSARNDRGEVYEPYSDNQYRHCHFGFYGNGDPLMAYRVLDNGDIMLVCITHHAPMFNATRRDAFVAAHKDQFPR
jgi:hypothetical protein